MHVILSLSTSSMLLGGLLLSGCRQLNPQNGLSGPGGDLPALRADPGSSLQAVVPAGRVVPLDRREWDQEAVIITRSQVEHFPSYGSAEPVIHELGVRSRRWPTTRSALDTGGMPDAEALNATLAPIVAAGNILVFPIRAVQTPMWVMVASDREASDFQLLPVGGTPPPWRWVDRPILQPEEAGDE